MDSVRNEKWRTRSRIPGGASVLPVLLLVVVLLPGSPAVNITWLPNQEWNTASNWVDGLVPKNGSHVVFPVEMRLSVGLPIQNFDLDLAGLELPRDGALALSKSGLITISEKKPSAKTARWVREGPLLWVEPNNWGSEKSAAAVPHLERIPCQDDVVVLPGLHSTVSIQLPMTRGTKVQAVRVTNYTQALPVWEWRNLRMQREFSAGPTTVEYTGLQNCLDCPCQPRGDGQEVLKEICATPGAACLGLACEYPLSIEGHCCSYCGGRIVISNKTSVSLMKRVADMALKNFGNTLSWHARRTWDSNGEILIAGKEKYSRVETIEAIVALKAVLQEQGIKVINSDMTGAEVYISQTTAILGPFFGMLLMIIVLLLVAFPYYGYSLPEVLGNGWNEIRGLVASRTTGILATATEPTLPRKPFRFAKFENAPDSEVELAATSSNVAIIHATKDDEDEDEDDEDGGGRFANPLYRSGRRAPEAPSFAALRNVHDDTADEEIDLGIEP